jgi:hydrogenase-4 component B
MALYLIMGACVLAAGSGLAGVVSGRRSMLGQRVTVGLMVVACGVGLAAGLGALMDGTIELWTLAGPLADWTFHFRIDPLSAFFLLPIFLLGGASSIYGLGYWPQLEHARNGRRLGLFHGLLVAGLAGVTLAADGITFLFAWEVMALSAFFLVSTEDHKPEARRAGWIYLIATHIGTLSLFALFAVLRSVIGSFELRRIAPGEAGTGLQAGIFLIALLGFGLKAGAMPLHFWLPGAHAAAPSHVSAVLSGVLLKIGIYGLLRTATLLPNLPAMCGLLVLLIGVTSAVLGVVFALGQHDLKRLLAYHSIENIGIILIGLGLSMVGSATNHPTWMVLGLAGCLLHVWNHSLFKGLLFLAAGSIVHATHTREIDHLGGLAKRMPATTILFAAGAVAICGLPPLNGFVSELMIYLGLFGAAADGHGGLVGIALAAPALAMVGALAVACFVKAYGAVFLGTARTQVAAEAHESPASMIAPMAVLASLCILIGLFPLLVLPLLDRVLGTWPGLEGQRISALVPYEMISILAASLIGVIAIGLIWVCRRSMPRQAGPTWDCGYIQSRATVQYTSSSFAQMLVGMFRWVLRPVTHHQPPLGLFPKPSHFESHVPDIILDGTLVPLWSRAKEKISAFKSLQPGRVQQYLLYILIALFVLLLSLVPVIGLVKRLLGH